MAASHTLVMTGASRGIGRLAAEHILADDPEVHLVLVTRGDSGAALVVDLGSRGRQVLAVSADLGSLRSVRAAAAQIVEKVRTGELPPLTGFVGNAGIQHTNALTVGAEDLEATFTVNVLANHVFVRAITDHFEPGSRVTGHGSRVTVSATHFGDLKHNLGMVPGAVWRDPRQLAKPGAFPNSSTTAAGRTAYSTSKLAAIYLVHEYARRLPVTVDAVAFNPGFVPGTGLARNADLVSRFVMARIMPLMAATPLATSKNNAGRYLADAILGRTKAPSGSYVDKATLERSSDKSYDPAREADLWLAVKALTTG